MLPAYTLHTANGTFHIRDGQLTEQPARDALVLDLPNYRVLPGLVNAHDHLELNHYPRTKFQERYTNAHQWGEDIDQRLRGGLYAGLRGYSIWERCWIGGLKNLLSGVTTVAHHGPLYWPLRRRGFPVRVLQRYGWAHSLHFDTDQHVQASYHDTPPDVPWFIHLAEGSDKTAASEYSHLKALGCAGPNTVIVHGVGLTADDLADAAGRIRGIVRCPTTNQYLLGQTASTTLGVRYGLGSDSRLTADGDLLHEPHASDPQVQAANRHIVGVGEWDAADLIVCKVTPPTQRTDLHLIVRGGVPMVGHPALMAKFTHIQAVRATLDGEPRLIHRQLARQARRCRLEEPGLQVQASVRRFFWQ